MAETGRRSESLVEFGSAQQGGRTAGARNRRLDRVAGKSQGVAGVISAPRPSRLSLAAICVAAFVAMLDTTVVGLILPRIGVDLHADVAGLAWVPNAYILTYALLIATAGVLGDRLGRRRQFVSGLLMFAIGSAGCATAPGLLWLIAARVIQGAGAAAMLTMALALISTTFTERRQWAVAIYVMVGSGAAALGPLVGGLLAQLGGWRFVFLVQVPIALAGVLLCLATLSESRGIARRADWVGLALASLALLALNAVLLQGARWGWSSNITLGAAATGFGALVAFVRWEARVDHPMLSIAIFGEPRLLAYTIAGACAWFAVLADVIYPSIYLQSDAGLAVGVAGLLVAAAAATSVLVAPAVDPVVRRFGPERVLVASMFALLVAVSPWAFTRADWPLWLTVGLLGLAAIPLTFVLAVSAAGALASFPVAAAGLGAASFNSVRQVGSALGVSVPAVALTTVLSGRQLTLGVRGLDGALDAAFAVRALVIAMAAVASTILLLQADRQRRLTSVRARPAAMTHQQSTRGSK
ncbi:MAG: MFS transporter [Candidatus Dormiibacterota bacterium]